jgi:hypothetical protein
MLRIILLGLAMIMFSMAMYVFRGGAIAFDAETNLEGRPAFAVAIFLVIGAAGIVFFTYVIMPQYTA